MPHYVGNISNIQSEYTRLPAGSSDDRARLIVKEVSIGKNNFFHTISKRFHHLVRECKPVTRSQSQHEGKSACLIATLPDRPLSTEEMMLAVDTMKSLNQHFENRFRPSHSSSKKEHHFLSRG